MSKEKQKEFSLDELMTENYGAKGTPSRISAEKKIKKIQKELTEPMQKGAVISGCKTYRYKLWRIWDGAKPSVLFIMLNPSTADASEDDATIRRCVNFAKAWGFGSLYVGNLYAYRTKDPEILLQAEKDGIDIVGDMNDRYITEMAGISNLVVFAWGAGVTHILARKRMVIMRHILPQTKLPHMLGKSKHGFPRHPLMLKKNIKPTLF